MLTQSRNISQNIDHGLTDLIKALETILAKKLLKT